MGKSAAQWAAWLGIPAAGLGAVALVTVNFVREDLANTVMVVAVVLAVAWFVIVATLWLRSVRAARCAVCPRCGHRVPVGFLEEVRADGSFGGMGDGAPERLLLVACKHCLYGEDYPK
jgi:hypothetical protein